MRPEVRVVSWPKRPRLPLKLPVRLQPDADTAAAYSSTFVRSEKRSYVRPDGIEKNVDDAFRERSTDKQPCACEKKKEY